MKAIIYARHLETREGEKSVEEQVKECEKYAKENKSLILFDTAVLHGVGRAKEYNKKSNGNIREILEFRREHYKNKVKKDPSQEKFLKGWNNRVDKLEKILNRYEGLE